MRAIYRAEWAYNSSEGGSTADDGLRNRLAYAGLSGRYGTASIGRQWSVYYNRVNKTDILNNAGAYADANSGYYLGTTRVGNMLTYIGPSFGDLSGQIALIIDHDPNHPAGAPRHDGIDGYNIGLSYDRGPASLGLSYLGSDKYADAAGLDPDLSLWGLGASWNFGRFKVIGQYESSETAGVDASSFALAGEAYFGNNTLRALYGSLDSDDAEEETDTYALGYQYNFSKRTRLYIEYYQIRNGMDVEEYDFGLRHDF